MRKDANHPTLREGWRRLGGSWLDLVPETGGEPDALIGWRGQDRLIEIKNPLARKSKQRPRANQREWHRSWRGRPVAVVTCLGDMVRLFESPEPSKVHRAA
jgi:hypothetical protein